MQIIPLNSNPNQTFQSVLLVDGANITLQFFIRWNSIAEYWVMRIIDPISLAVLLEDIPMVTGGNLSSANLLAQYAYLQIGSAYIQNVGGVTPDPAIDDLGTNFILIWGDTDNG